MITPEQAAWAEMHDWFVSYDPVTGTVHTLERFTDLDGVYRENPRKFTDFGELEGWAGY